MTDHIERELRSLRMSVEGLISVVGKLEERLENQQQALEGAENSAVGVQEVIQGIGAVLSGEANPKKSVKVTKLTARQHAVMQGLLYSVKDEDLVKIMGGISPETVKTHRREVGKKFGVTKKAEMRVAAQRWMDEWSDADYIASTGGFGKTYIKDTDPDTPDEHRHLIAPVKKTIGDR